jgi:hypothetical protein
MVQSDNERELSLHGRGRIRSGSTLVGRVLTMQAVKGRSMEKRLCYGAMGVSGFLLLLFLLDLLTGLFGTGFPFGGVNKFVDILGILASGVVLYLAYDAFRDLR